MFEIKGKLNTAICYASVVESDAIEQIRRMCSYEITAGSRIRIMPDVHAGRGCTVGTTMTVSDKVVPNIVGTDIGCGMYTVNLGRSPIDFAEIDLTARNGLSGNNLSRIKNRNFSYEGLRCYRDLNNLSGMKQSLGTLGGGNHFIEIDEAVDGTRYLIVHSGSRSLGKQVAEFYQNLAIKFNNGYEVNCDAGGKYSRSEKKSGQRKTGRELSAARQFGNGSSSGIPDDLCFLSGRYLDDYLHDVEICQAFARLNREIIADILLKGAGLTGRESFHTVHNYVDTREMILRKGAIAAHDGEIVLIPINMRDGCVLARGRGNPEWNYSAPHGAGRLLSRGTAKSSLDMNEYRESMKGIYTTSVNESTLDESPMAYKSLHDIVDVIDDTVEVLDIMRPVYNFKA
jgi:RNA-splicing ligase RtcB